MTYRDLLDRSILQTLRPQEDTPLEERARILKEIEAMREYKRRNPLAREGTHFSDDSGACAPNGKRIRHPDVNPAPLTQCESRVLALIREGKTTQEIATALGRSVKTIEDRRREIRRKGVEGIERRSTKGKTFGKREACEVGS